ncbi:hypothetical protein C8R45DRAFT_173239 [Mycena sanguinolenta]|nr:hypothetical protein C8R45DRAFT_173239 [Mycena sanguinolenta]
MPCGRRMRTTTEDIVADLELIEHAGDIRDSHYDTTVCLSFPCSLLFWLCVFIVSSRVDECVTFPPPLLPLPLLSAPQCPSSPLLPLLHRPRIRRASCVFFISPASGRSNCLEWTSRNYSERVRIEGTRPPSPKKSRLGLTNTGEYELPRSLNDMMACASHF